jgi:outer membrane receptor protein involved in Fe transport
LLLWLGLAVPALAQTIRGQVYDAQTKEPIIGATVLVVGTTTGAATNHQGEFSLAAPAAPCALKVSVVGYQALEVAATPSGQPLRIALEPAVGELEEVVVTASREAGLRTESAMAISKLTPKMIDEAKPTSVYEVINKTPGVLMTNLNNEQHSMSIRQPMSTANYYLYMEDGIGIRPMGVFNHNALLEINQFAISSIEVVKGPVSSIYGPEAVGGAINFITQRPTAVPTVRLGLQADQWGYRRLQFGAGARLGKLGVYVGGLTSQQIGSWLANSDYDKTSVNLRLDYHLSPRTRLVGTFMYGKYYSQMSGSVDSVAFYSRQYLSTTDFTYRKSDASRSRLSLERDWAGGGRSFVTLFHRFNEHGQNPSYAIRWAPGASTARGEINSNNFSSYGILAQHSQPFNFLNSKLLVGAMYDYSPNDYWSYQTELAAQLRPDRRSVERYTLVRERPELPIANYSAKLRNSAAYLQYDLEPLPRLRLSAGLRYDRMSFTYDNYLDRSSGGRAYRRFTPKLGATYELAEGRGLYANYSQGFAPPGLTAIFRRRPNPDANAPAEFYYNLEPAQFQNYEVGGWASLLQNRLYLDLALYQMNGTNELLNIRQPDNSFDYQSAGRTLHRGLEFGFSAKPSRQLWLRWGGTTALHRFEDFQISTRQSDQVRNLAGFEMPQAPRWTWNAELTYYPAWLKGFRAAVEWQRVSGWYQNQINTVRYQGYHLLNFRTGYQWRGLEVFANVMNLTDALYATSSSRGNNPTDRSTFTPSAPRTLVLGVQYNFAAKPKS